MKHGFLLLTVAIAVVVSGCLSGDSGGSINFSGDLNTTDSSFRLDGKVVNSGYADVTHRNVSVYLFTANGSIINSTHIGTLQRSADVTLTADRIPKYVIFNAPSFWEYDEIDVSYYEFVKDSESPNGIYTERSVSSESEFPVNVTTVAT
ncbi:hypothetical protein [Haloarcula argentinensis]|uniref:Uncharacterized protein n=1 Tax=Haloarcula argentinensis TaxID=43776 RepID=A0A847U0P2_HALAR|nr:hypothetical protein [Haloarcula argentinensis]NLV11812.1 hypothetical protein [Haloarcula argentinensis]